MVVGFGRFFFVFGSLWPPAYNNACVSLFFTSSGGHCFPLSLSHGGVPRMQKLRTPLVGAHGAGFHDNVRDRPSGKVAPVGYQLATTALKHLNCHYPERWFARQKLSPNLGRQCIWTELHGRSCHPIWDVSASGLGCTAEVVTQSGTSVHLD